VSYPRSSQVAEQTALCSVLPTPIAFHIPAPLPILSWGGLDFCIIDAFTATPFQLIARQRSVPMLPITFYVTVAAYAHCRVTDIGPLAHVRWLICLSQSLVGEGNQAVERLLTRVHKYKRLGRSPGNTRNVPGGLQTSAPLAWYVRARSYHCDRNLGRGYSDMRRALRLIGLVVAMVPRRADRERTQR
jgi:hypothetical protein